MSEEVPYVMIAPVKDRENSVETGPTRTALTDWLKISRPWIASSIAHDDTLDALGVYQFLHFFFKV